MFDTAGTYDTTTYVFTPNVAGYYLFHVQVRCTTTLGTTNSVQIYIFKNNTATGSGYQGTITGVVAGNTISVSAVVAMNGTTDNVRAVVWQNTGGAISIPGTTQEQTQFYGTWQRAL